jgi:hypothetical protein
MTHAIMSIMNIYIVPYRLFLLAVKVCVACSISTTPSLQMCSATLASIAGMAGKELLSPKNVSQTRTETPDFDKNQEKCAYLVDLCVWQLELTQQDEEAFLGRCPFVCRAGLGDFDANLNQEVVDFLQSLVVELRQAIGMVLVVCRVALLITVVPGRRARILGIIAVDVGHAIFAHLSVIAVEMLDEPMAQK